MLRDPVVVVVAVVRTRLRAIPLAMIARRKSTQGFPFLSYMSMGLRLAALRAAGARLLSFKYFLRHRQFPKLGNILCNFWFSEIEHEVESQISTVCRDTTLLERSKTCFKHDLMTLIWRLSTDEVAEWLRRWTANSMCSARVGSNPILVVSVVYIFSESTVYAKRFAEKVNIRFSLLLWPKKSSRVEF